MDRQMDKQMDRPSIRDGLIRGISQEAFSRTYYLGQKSSATYGTGPFIDKIMSNLLSQTPKHYI